MNTCVIPLKALNIFWYRGLRINILNINMFIIKYKEYGVFDAYLLLYYYSEAQAVSVSIKNTVSR